MCPLAFGSGGCCDSRAAVGRLWWQHPEAPVTRVYGTSLYRAVHREAVTSRDSHSKRRTLASMGSLGFVNTTAGLSLDSCPDWSHRARQDQVFPCPPEMLSVICPPAPPGSMLCQPRDGFPPQEAQRFRVSVSSGASVLCQARGSSLDPRDSLKLWLRPRLLRRTGYPTEQ